MILEDQKKAEEVILKFWKSKKIPEKVKKRKKRAKKFYFVDGPPYATGSIHMGTALNKVLKDTYIRFWRMTGLDVWNQPGYDTHGLPIENKVEKQLGFKKKSDIEKFGIKKFIKECKKFSTKFIKVMSEQFNNLGVWMDWDNPYLTLNNDYIEGAWFTFKKAFEKGLLYKGKYPVHVCPRCETALAYNELNYRKDDDVAIYVKFKLKNRRNEFLVIWTTTPWTLPANTGVMAKPDADYVKVRVNNEILILAQKLLRPLMDKIGSNTYSVIETLKGSELNGYKYIHPLAKEFSFQRGLRYGHRVVMSGQYVNLEEGTGLVHTAPGHGHEDFKVGKDTGLPAISPVKIDGTYNKNCGKFSGMYVKDADDLIIQELEKQGLLLHREKVTHDYPHCWRCESPLLLISLPQWFFKVTQIRDKLIEENKKVNWYPDWAGDRFHNWLESLGDWPISRQRYWGIPLPIWICEECNEVKVIGSRKELKKVPKDFHKPYIDKVTLECERCDGKMRRIPDVLDVWFDSGVCSWASIGYPKDKKLFKKLWPGDLNIEGPDQIRGWWNSELITSIITFDKAPFKSILFHGFILDAHGIKMSKSKGNIVMPKDMIEKYGRDVLRFYLLSSPPWNDFYFNIEDTKEVAKQFNILRNTFNFVDTYVDKLPRTKRLKTEDKWLLSRINTITESYMENFQNYNGHKAVQELMDFILNDLSRWYIKLVRHRVWPLYKGKDKDGAFYTLVVVTKHLAKLLAPICPFIAEDVYQNVLRKYRKGLKSIHMYDFPEVDKKKINKKLEKQMEIIKRISEVSNFARQQAHLKLRWPVKRLLVLSKNNEIKRAARDLEDILKNMCNVKNVRTGIKKPKGKFVESKFEETTILLDLEEDDKILFERLYRELTRNIQSMRKKNGLVVEERIALSLKSDEKTEKKLKKFSKDLKQDVGAKKVQIGKLKGKFSSELTFKDKKVEISFSKV